MPSFADDVDQDLYEVLNLQPSAVAEDIRKAYRRAALAMHPDKGGSNENFHLITFAFDVLSCPIARGIYDVKMRCRPYRHRVHGIKRPASPVHIEAPLTKRKSSVKTEWTMKKTVENAARVDSALETLRTVLRDLKVSERLAAISGMAPQTRGALLAYMEHGVCSNGTAERKGGDLTECCKRVPGLQTFSKPSRGVWMVRGVAEETRYKARVNFHSLCLYGRWQAKVETAIEHQIALVQMRSAVLAESMVDVDLWRNSTKVSQLCQTILADCRVSEEELGLRAYVTMRAFGCRMESSALPIGQAWALRAELVQARETSWDALREVWIRCLCVGRKHRSASEAVAFVDGARKAALQLKLSRSLRVAERELALRPEAGKKVGLL